MSDTTIAVLIIGGLLVGIALFIGFVVVFTRRAARERREALRRVAGHLRLDFRETGPESMVSELSHYHLFSQGHGKKILNVCSGRVSDVSSRIFDYQYTGSGGGHSTTHYQTVALFETPDLNLPAFQARPENFFHRIGEKFGMQDIDFEQDEEFSKKYLLKGDDEAGVRRLFNNPVRSHLATLDKTTVEGRGNQLLVHRPGKRVAPEDLDDFLKSSVHVLVLFKTAAAP